MAVLISSHLYLNICNKIIKIINIFWQSMNGCKIDNFTGANASNTLKNNVAIIL